METNYKIELLRYLSSFILSIIVILVLTRIRKSYSNTYFVKPYGLTLCFAIAFFAMVLAFPIQKITLTIFLLFFSVFFLLIGILVSCEYVKIDGKMLIIKNNALKIEKVDIESITIVDFLIVTGNSEEDSSIDFVINNDSRIRMKSNITNLDEFIDRLQKINPELTIARDVPILHNKSTNVINVLFTLLFLILGFSRLLKMVIK